MVVLGSGRREHLGFIEQLTLTEKTVLMALLDWNHMATRSNSYGIANKCLISVSGVGMALRSLADRGIVLRSASKTWFIKPDIKERLMSEFGHKDSARVSEPVPSETAQSD